MEGRRGVGQTEEAPLPIFSSPFSMRSTQFLAQSPPRLDKSFDGTNCSDAATRRVANIVRFPSAEVFHDADGLGGGRADGQY